MSGKWTGIGFILDFEDRQQDEVAFIINVPGGEVTINDLRKAAAAPALYEALKYVLRTRGIKCLHAPGPDKFCANCQAKAALSQALGEGKP